MPLAPRLSAVACAHRARDSAHSLPAEAPPASVRRFTLSDWIWDAQWLDNGAALAVALGHNIAELYAVTAAVGPAPWAGALPDTPIGATHLNPACSRRFLGPDAVTEGVVVCALPALLGQVFRPLLRDGRACKRCA